MGRRVRAAGSQVKVDATSGTGITGGTEQQGSRPGQPIHRRLKVLTTIRDFVSPGVPLIIATDEKAVSGRRSRKLRKGAARRSRPRS